MGDLGGLVPFRSVEAWLPAWLSEALPVGVVSRMMDGQPYPFVLVKEVPYAGVPSRDRERVWAVDVEIHAFASGLDAEEEARSLGIACETLICRWADEGRLIDGREKLSYARIFQSAVRRTDWSEAVSMVQYQDLPTGVERYMSHARLMVTRRIS